MHTVESNARRTVRITDLVHGGLVQLSVDQTLNVATAVSLFKYLSFSPEVGAIDFQGITAGYDFCANVLANALAGGNIQMINYDDAPYYFYTERGIEILMPTAIR